MPDRQDFFVAMTEALRASPGERASGMPFEAGQIKVRLVEAHQPEPGEDGAGRLLAQIFEGEGLAVERFAESLHLVRGEEVVLAVDTIDSRFWQVFSTSLSQPFSRVIKRALTQNTHVDAAWIPKALLREMEGTHRWLKSSFESDDLLGDTSPARRWRARFEGDTPDELLELLAREPKWARASALAAIGTSVTETGIGSAQVLADWRGNFTIARGDFNVGASAVTRAADRYASFVRALEGKYQMRFSPAEHAEHGIELQGDVAVIPFEDSVEDVRQIVEGLFLAKEPFRLWAVPRQIDDDEWEANAVDLHVGQPLRLEVSRYRLRVLLNDSTCGNTLARLLTNLQHRLDARIRLQPA
jgi:hypothetical protein